MAQTGALTPILKGYSISPALQKYYEEQFSMMATQGWKDLCEDLENVLKPLNDASTATLDNLHNRQGRIAEIKLVLTRRDTLSATYKELQEDDT